jgi:hypothetical protein
MYTLIFVAPLVAAQCSKPAENCYDTTCCVQPEGASGPYGCFRRAGRNYAQCRPVFGWVNHTEAPAGECTDDETWLCPSSWLHAEAQTDAAQSVPAVAQSACDGLFQSCTESLCCKNPASACYRRPAHYYAQCRTTTACTPWMDRAAAPEGGWLCPGWESCANPWDECTLSRCCTDENFACYLNKSSVEPRLWYAQCRPSNQTTTSVGRLGWILWTESAADALWQSVKVQADTLSAGEVVAIVLASTLTALGALCACWRTRNTIRRLEAELAVAVDAARHARSAKSHNEGVSLMAEGASPGAADHVEEPDELVVRSGLSGRVCRMPSEDTQDSQEHGTVVSAVHTGM